MMGRSFQIAIVSFAVLFCLVPETEQACTQPSVGDNVVFSPVQESYTDYSLIEISCTDGSAPVGTDYSYCYPGGVWTPDPSSATCEQSCSLPIVSDDVTISPVQTSYSKGETVSFSCVNGTLEGSTTGTCGDNATWNIPSSPNCLGGCQAPEYSNGTGRYDHSATVTFSCDDRYALSSGESTTESTCNDGSWTPSVECQLSGCGTPVVRANVTYSPTSSSSYDFDSRITLSCPDESTPFGPDFAYCNSSGIWEPTPYRLKCYDKCQTPSFADSRVVVTSVQTSLSGESSYDHADTVKVTCTDGVYVDGPWRASCNSGTWSPLIGVTNPVCRANCTAPANTLQEGQVYLHGRADVFQCVSEPGMVRLGGPRAFCNDGTWKPNLLCKYKTEL